jgi:hypothetical protein
MSVILTPAPVSVVSSPTTVIVCGTAPLTGAAGCDVIPVPSPTPGGAGGITPSVPVVPVTPGVPPPVVPATPAVPVAPVVPVAPLVPPAQPIAPPMGAGPTSDIPIAPGVAEPPLLRASTELLTVLQFQSGAIARARAPGALTFSGELGAPESGALARMELARSKSLQVFGTASTGGTNNVLGTSAEMRMIRDPGFEYTEMMVGW